MRFGPMALPVLLALAAGIGPARADYLFSTPRAKEQNRVYWLDRYTGTIGACEYQPKGTPLGSMNCLPPGDNAKGLPSGDYDLMPSNWDSEWGIFRVNRTTGEVSLCFVRDERVVCTPQSIAR
jgi:hypothetical protein